MQSLSFLRAFLAAPRQIGAVWPSGRALAAAMLAPVDFAATQVLVEFGPGMGAFSGAIAARIRPGSQYIAIEQNPAFCRALKAAYPGIDVVEGSVADLAGIMAARGVTTIDAIICGLPWASLPLPLQDRIFTAMAALLAPGGVFVTFAYPQGLLLPGARLLRRKLAQRFARITRSPIVWANLPPAFVYICRGNRLA